jgi:group I intron endonuclease
MIIYRTTNLKNGKIYVGKDTKNSKNYLGSGVLLKKAIKKYGKENFIKEILETCENEEQLNEREKFWINKLNSNIFGYNLTDGGTGGDTFSKNPNKEDIRCKLRDRIVSDDILEKRKQNLIQYHFRSGENHPNFGKKQTETTKEKRKQTFLKNGFTSPMFGKKHNEETKRKISEKKKGTILSEETKQKMRNAANKEKKQKIFICPYCEKEGGNTMFRWHFENCKNKL